MRQEILSDADIDAFRETALQAVGDIARTLADLPATAVWRAPTPELREGFAEPLGAPQSLSRVYQDYLDRIAPYAGGNRHPGFMGWAQGAGAPSGMLAELLMASLNLNCGGRDHVGHLVERQVAGWVRDWFSFPQTATGLFVTGASQANFMAVLAARTRALGRDCRVTGLGADGLKLRGYAGKGAHACLPRAFEMAGLGSEALRLIPLDAEFRMDLEALERAIAADRAAGLTPFMIAACAGTVDVGAFDDLEALARIAETHGLWLHVDGAFGAHAIHSAAQAWRLAGVARAHSLAMEFHKWGQVPYDAGFLLVRDEARLLDTFAGEAAYLSREPDGLAAGAVWPTDIGPDLSRACRALKAWFVLRAHGVEAIGANVDLGVSLARDLAGRVAADPRLETLGDGGLNIVCFRYVGRLAPEALDAANREIVRRLHQEGRVAPSTTRINGVAAIRAAFFNPRSGASDVEALLEGVLRLGAGIETRG